jgi:hypothetical protein
MFYQQTYCCATTWKYVCGVHDAFSGKNETAKNADPDVKKGSVSVK